MAPTFLAPGVYVDEIPSLPPSVSPVATAIPAFIGYTEKAADQTANDLHLKPTRISSLAEYETFFGGPQKEERFSVTITETGGDAATVALSAKAALAEADRARHILYYALQLFFANGGGCCYIVSVNCYKPVFGEVLVGAELLAGLNVLAKIDEPTLIVFPEAQSLPIADYKALHGAALKQCEQLHDRFVVMDLHGSGRSLSDPATNILDAAADFRRNGIGTGCLKYGAVYCPNVETVLDFVVDESKTDVTIIANGTAAPPVKLATLISGDSRCYALAKAAIRDFPYRLPPSSAVAGIYATVDSSRGVWKAPANITLNAVTKPTIPMSNEVQGSLNVDATTGKSINAIRSFPGKGTIVWGARTLAGNDNEWRYVSVRRFFNFVEESCRKATEPFVFEPNDATTWGRVQTMLENFLTDLWRQGALQGAKPEHAFYVQVGLGKTMAPLDILEGRLILEIGLAAVRPAEFIILKFSHKMVQA